MLHRYAPSNFVDEAPDIVGEAAGLELGQNLGLRFGILADPAATHRLGRGKRFVRRDAVEIIVDVADRLLKQPGIAEVQIARPGG